MKIECVSSSAHWPKCIIHSLLLSPHYHVPIGRARKKRRVKKDEKAENALKVMVKDARLSRRESLLVNVVQRVTTKEHAHVQGRRRQMGKETKRQYLRVL